MVRLAERMGEDIVTFERQVTGHDLRPSGELRVTTNDTALIHLMTDVFAEFRKAYPEIVLDVVVSNQALNLSKRDADVAVRATDRPPEALIGRRAASIAWAVFGAIEKAPETFDPAERRARRRLDRLRRQPRQPEGREMAEGARRARAASSIASIPCSASPKRPPPASGFAVLPCFIGSATPGLTRLTAAAPRARRRDLAADPCGPAPDRARARLHGFRRERNRQAAQGDRGDGVIVPSSCPANRARPRPDQLQLDRHPRLALLNKDLDGRASGRLRPSSTGYARPCGLLNKIERSCFFHPNTSRRSAA